MAVCSSYGLLNSKQTHLTCSNPALWVPGDQARCVAVRWPSRCGLSTPWPCRAGEGRCSHPPRSRFQGTRHVRALVERTICKEGHGGGHVHLQNRRGEGVIHPTRTVLSGTQPSAGALSRSPGPPLLGKGTEPREMLPLAPACPGQRERAASGGSGRSLLEPGPSAGVRPACREQ